MIHSVKYFGSIQEKQRELGGVNPVLHAIFLALTIVATLLNGLGEIQTVGRASSSFSCRRTNCLCTNSSKFLERQLKRAIGRYASGWLGSFPHLRCGERIATFKQHGKTPSERSIEKGGKELTNRTSGEFKQLVCNSIKTTAFSI